MEELAKKSRRMWKNIKLLWEYICDIIEFALTIIATIAIVVAIVCLIPSVIEYIVNGATPESFMTLLSAVFVIVVGVEFLKMLCKPSTDNVIEVLVFLVARHMIIGENTAMDNLLSVLSIAILFIVWLLIHNIRKIGVDNLRAHHDSVREALHQAENGTQDTEPELAAQPLSDLDAEDEGDVEI